jgi:3-hydroxybutyryl-CoA dehydrogenase
MAIEHVGIVGSGIMGSGIAELAAKAGCRVTVRSRSLATCADMLAGLERSLAKQVERGKLDETEAQAVRARVSGTAVIDDLAECDLVIESVIEDLAIKKELFAELDRVVKAGAILATNTSTLPVIDLAMQTSRPDRVCGLHFFNPATAMSLVEIVAPLSASDATLEEVTAFATACGKDPVRVKDQAGFIVNALLFPYLNNAIRLHEQGVGSIEGIDAAMKGGCGFPMGPFALLDLVGLDTSLSILEALYLEFADANYSPVPLLRRMVSAGRLGRKSGQGFYSYR